MIKENVRKILEGLPRGVELEAAAKGRTAQEILEAIDAGIKIIGENYVQEAQGAFAAVGRKARWHFIGRLQRNKVKKVVEIFDAIETVDSFEIAQEIDRRSLQVGKKMEILIEINSGREEQKSGIFPEDAQALAEKLSVLKNLEFAGLMTMGPFLPDPKELRPYFTQTRQLFEKLKALGLPNTDMKYLSMGMTNSYKTAVEEGANIVRIGTAIFGPRK
ncbi:YggS family pyridoxal phosphate-dependent enzyme [Candidatus Desantisbacteria bacterium CG_4_10_14_0_8_um_filter_48_22]|uniref:Pyridoxal phosphate homeostasis protein n=1 Tax=Candidatus Desantisbacteria bacterium CG_4_10_14_0_8_um_filter_48_22 TaxID=1974543 RepID=A0A2M7S6P9_9BACT|nr:MAG: YggS family pyridoxal phosphate-dependent enzyme [Candidatus Desantisbacteria bacterium CG_4_10_14_0_8_um_filter_48_22]